MADKEHYDDVFWKTRNTLLNDEDSQANTEDELPADAKNAVILPEAEIMDAPLLGQLADEEDAGKHPKADPEDPESDAAHVNNEQQDDE